MKRCIIIEDSKMMATILAQLLRQCVTTSQVFYAPNAQQGYQLLTKHKADIIFLDLNLSQPLDGIDVLMNIREIYPDLPIVIVTSDSEMETVKKVIAHNPTDYLIKPLSLNKLQICLDKIFPSLQ